MADDNAWPNAKTMIPDLLQAAPSARQVLDRNGLRGCGGSWGPAESLEFFSHAHGAQHGDMLQRVCDLYQALDDELSGHLLKEEAVLFPYIVAAEAHRNGASERPAACFGSVEHPIHQMENEHESAGQILVEIRALTGDYRLPTDACPTFRAFYEELVRMEGDLHQHIHLENNILFPRAIAAESSRPSAVVKLSGGRGV